MRSSFWWCITRIRIWLYSWIVCWCEYFANIAHESGSLCAETLYNALPEAIRGIRGYKKYVSALKKIVYANKFYPQDEFFFMIEFLLSCRSFPRVNFSLFILFIISWFSFDFQYNNVLTSLQKCTLLQSPVLKVCNRFYISLQQVA